MNGIKSLQTIFTLLFCTTIFMSSFFAPLYGEQLLEEGLSHLKQQIAKLSQQIETDKQKDLRREEEIKKLIEEKNSLEKNKTTAESNLITLKTELEKLKIEIESLNKKAEAEKQDDKKLKANIQEITISKQKAESELSQIKTKLTNIEAKLKETETGKASMERSKNSAIIKWQNSCNLLEQQLAKAKQNAVENPKLRATIATLRKQIAEFQKQILQYKAALERERRQAQEAANLAKKHKQEDARTAIHSTLPTTQPQKAIQSQMQRGQRAVTHKPETQLTGSRKALRLKTIEAQRESRVAIGRLREATGDTVKPAGTKQLGYARPTVSSQAKQKPKIPRSSSYADMQKKHGKEMRKNYMKSIPTGQRKFSSEMERRRALFEQQR